MNHQTPQEQAENILAGIKNTYKLVAVKHVRPWYSWALIAVAIGFATGVAYVANQHAQFDASRAFEFIPGMAGEPVNRWEPNAPPILQNSGLINSADTNLPGGEPIERNQYKIVEIGKSSSETVGNIECFVAKETSAPEEREGHRFGPWFFDGWHYNQMDTKGCTLVTLINMNIDAYKVDLAQAMLDCAAKNKINWQNGVDQDKYNKLLLCKMDVLAGLGIEGTSFGRWFFYGNGGFNYPVPGGKSPCKNIADVLASGGSAAIDVSNGKQAHTTQVTAIDCKNGTATLEDPNGFQVKIKFNADGDLTDVQPPMPGSAYAGGHIKASTTENKKK